VLPRVFEPGFRGSPARTPTGTAGAGLGLAIVSAVVGAYGGTVTVANIDTDDTRDDTRDDAPVDLLVDLHGGASDRSTPAAGQGARPPAGCRFEVRLPIDRRPPEAAPRPTPQPTPEPSRRPERAHGEGADASEPDLTR
jgi:signal transduction histidine kinase